MKKKRFIIAEIEVYEVVLEAVKLLSVDYPDFTFNYRLHPELSNTWYQVTVDTESIPHTAIKTRIRDAIENRKRARSKRLDETQYRTFSGKAG